MLYRFAVALALCTACSGAQDTGIEPVACSTESTLTYANFGKDLIDTNCMECHDTRSPRLGTLSQIRLHTDEILDTAVYTDAMPEENGMPLQQRELLGEWLACGAP